MGTLWEHLGAASSAPTRFTLGRWMRPLAPVWRCRTSSGFYPIPDDGGSDGVEGLTPRLACLVWIGAQRLAEEWRCAADDPSSAHAQELIATLPRITRPRCDVRWLDRFAMCLDDIAFRVGAGVRDDVARCTGDELALHLVVSSLAEALDLGRDLRLPADFEHYPNVPEVDDDILEVTEILLADHDILMLYDPRLDGIESHDLELRLVNLHPAEWFRPFPQRPSSQLGPANTAPPTGVSASPSPHQMRRPPGSRPHPTDVALSSTRELPAPAAKRQVKCVGSLDPLPANCCTCFYASDQRKRSRVHVDLHPADYLRRPLRRRASRLLSLPRRRSLLQSRYEVPLDESRK